MMMMMTRTIPLQSHPFYPPRSPLTLIMEDEHLDTILTTKSDEVIKSSVEDLVPIPRESEGIFDDTCDVPFCDNFLPLDVLNNHFEIFSNFNDDCISSDDDSFEDIDYVEVSPSNSELISLEEDLNQFCGMKGIKREFSVARTPQQNGVAERKNRTLIKAARTMLADSLLPISFWAEAVNTACYVQNRESLMGKMMKDFWLYTLSIAIFRVFNSRTRIVQQTLHIKFLENKPNVAGIGPKWLFDIDTLTQSINYQPVVTGNQPNDNAGIKENLDADDDVVDVSFDVKENENDVHVSPSESDKTDNKKDDEKAKRDDKGKSHVDSPKGVRDLRAEFEEFSFNNTNRVNVVSALVNAAGPNLTSTNIASPSVNAVSLNFGIAGKSSFVDPSKYPDDPDMPELEDIVYSNDEEEVGAEADLSNLETNIPVSPILTTRVYKDHPVTQIIGDLTSAPQTRSMTRMVKEQGWIVVENKRCGELMIDNHWMDNFCMSFDEFDKETASSDGLQPKQADLCCVMH
nr:hypothetical protein [Tanacetum cinerariifolium]